MRTTEIIEALLFASDAPLTAADLSRAHEDLDEDAVEQAILALRAEYDATNRAFQVYEIAGGYQLLTRPEYAGVLERFHTVPQSGRLSGPALEVLAIIAYRQPIGRAEIEEIRGIGSAGVLRTLQDRQLIDVVGRGEGLGRPLLYGTTQKFLDHFGFNSLHDLPRPDELPVVLKQRAPADGAAPPAAEAESRPEPAAQASAQPAEPPAPEVLPQADAAPESPRAESVATESPQPVQASAESPQPEPAAAEPPRAEAVSEPAAEAETQPEAEAASEPEAPAESEPGAEPQSELQAEVQSQPEAEAPSEPEAEPQSEPEAQAQSDPAALADEGPAEPSGSAASNGAGQVGPRMEATAVEPGASAN